MRFTDLAAATGVSLKPEYLVDALALKTGDAWFEVHPENYMIGGGPRLEGLLCAAERFPISLHGVGASLGGLSSLVAIGESSEPAAWGSVMEM